jgi:toxin ParE1/3/4
VKGYFLTDLAREDLHGIWMHLAKDNVEASLKAMFALGKAFDKVVANPQIGHYREDLADKRQRFILAHPYLIMYRPDKRPVEILRILHGSRDLQTLLSAPQ